MAGISEESLRRRISPHRVDRQARAVPSTTIPQKFIIRLEAPFETLKYRIGIRLNAFWSTYCRSLRFLLAQ
jgi:hypothetical protein